MCSVGSVLDKETVLEGNIEDEYIMGDLMAADDEDGEASETPSTAAKRCVRGRYFTRVLL